MNNLNKDKKDEIIPREVLHLRNFFYSHTKNNTYNPNDFKEIMAFRVRAINLCRETMISIGVDARHHLFTPLLTYLITNATNERYIPPPAMCKDEFRVIYYIIVDGHINVNGYYEKVLPVDTEVSFPSNIMPLENIIADICNNSANALSRIQTINDAEAMMPMPRSDQQISMYLAENYILPIYVVDTNVVQGRHTYDVFLKYFQQRKILSDLRRSSMFINIDVTDKILDKLSYQDCLSLRLVSKKSYMASTNRVKETCIGRRVFDIFFRWFYRQHVVCNEAEKNPTKCLCAVPCTLYRFSHYEIFDVNRYTISMYYDKFNSLKDLFQFRNTLTCFKHQVPLCHDCANGTSEILSSTGLPSMESDVKSELSSRYNIVICNNVLAVAIYSLRNSIPFLLSCFKPAIFDYDDSVVAYYVTVIIRKIYPEYIGTWQYETCKNYVYGFFYYWKVGRSSLAWCRSQEYPDIYVRNKWYEKMMTSRRKGINTRGMYYDCKTVINDRFGPRWIDRTTGELEFADEHKSTWDNGPTIFSRKLPIPKQGFIRNIQKSRNFWLQDLKFLISLEKQT